MWEGDVGKGFVAGFGGWGLSREGMGWVGGAEVSFTCDLIYICMESSHLANPTSGVCVPPLTLAPTCVQKNRRFYSL